MISEGGDGFRQHYRALLYYSNYLKELFGNFIRGNFVVPRWDFSIGEGADILLTLHLHAIGDIFAFFSFLCPEKYMYLYYEGITILRMYCSGLFFSMLCFYLKKNRRHSVLCGALIYAFCAFSVTSMFNHVYFISAAVYLPLIILGVEKVINNDRPYLLIAAVMISALSNFYFFYMNVVSTVIYVIIRLLFIDRDNREKIVVLFRVTLYSLVGLLLGSVVFLPMLATMLNNNRMNAPVEFGFLFPLSTYFSYFTRMTFHGSYFGGFSYLWIISFSYLFVKRKKPVLIALLIIALLFVNLPHLSSIYHAFTYPTDRWFFAVSLLVGYIVVDALDDYEGINKMLPINIILSIIYYVICIFIDPDSRMLHIAFLVYTIIALITLKFFKKEIFRNIIVVASVAVFFMIEMFYLFSPYYWSYVRSGTSISDIEKKTKEENIVFEKIKDDDFFRYSGYRLSENANIHGDVSSTQHYWSIINNNIVEFRGLLGYSDSSLHHINNYGERFSQNALSGVRYYVNGDEDYIPYGFTYLDTIDGYRVYRSEYALPMVYGYDSYLSLDDFNNLDPVKRNESLVQSAVLDSDIDGISKGSLRYDSEKVLCTVSTTDTLNLESHTIDASGDNAFIYLDTKHEGKGEYYVVVSGLYSNKITAYIRVRYNDIEKMFVFKGTDNQHYTNRHDYIVNLGYLDNIDGRISIDFSDGGSYTYDSIELIYQPLDYQIECLDNLKKINIRSLDVGINKVNTELNIDEDRIICFSIPYSKGWKAYVDGKKADLIRCNVQYTGLKLDKGNHIVELRYSTPLHKEGLVMSMLGVIALVYMIIKDRKDRQGSD